MTPKGEKLACERCIRGHRVAQCQHTDRPLLRVSRKGRPVSQCNHCRTLRTSRSVHTNCKCASTSRQAVLKQFGRERCRCCEGGTCRCAYKSDHTATNGIPSPISSCKSSIPSTILSPAESEHRATEVAPAPLHSDDTGSLAPSHHRAETIGTVSTPSLSSLNDWPSGGMLNLWPTPSEGPLLGLLQCTQDLTGTWDSIPSLGMNEQDYMMIPTLDDSLSTIDSFGLGNLFSEPGAGRMTVLDNWNPLDFMTMDYHDPNSDSANLDFLDS